MIFNFTPIIRYSVAFRASRNVFRKKKKKKKKQELVFRREEKSVLISGFKTSGFKTKMKWTIYLKINKHRVCHNNLR